MKISDQIQMMKDNFDFEVYKKHHVGDLKTLLKIYWVNKPIWKSRYFWFSLILAIIVQGVIFCVEKTFYDCISYLCDQMINIMPNILGFNLGGYVLLIGLNSQSILDQITEPKESEDYSLFQRKSSVFAFSILTQILTILLACLFIGGMFINNETFYPRSFALTINFVVFFIINFVSIYSMVLIIQIVLNIFNYGQILHFFVRIDRLEKENRSNE